MKKLILLSTALAFFSLNANAQFNRTDYYINKYQNRTSSSSVTAIRPYLGADYVYTMNKFKKIEGQDVLKKNTNGYAFSGGLRFHENLAFELSYQQAFKGRKTLLDGKTEHRLSTIGADLVANTSTDNNFEFLASLGLGYYILKYNFRSPGEKYSSHGERLGIRAGVGAQYFLTDNVALRAMARYNYVKMKGSKKEDYQGFGGLKNSIDLTAGARLYF